MKLATSSGLASSEMLYQLSHWRQDDEGHLIDYLGTGKLSQVSNL